MSTGGHPALHRQCTNNVGFWEASASTMLTGTRYARSGEVHIAYQVVGEGELDLVWIPSLAHHVELSWENPPVARFLVRVAELGRLVVFDKRGTGMSDRVSSDTTLETRMDDIRAVMDAAGRSGPSFALSVRAVRSPCSSPPPIRSARTGSC